MKAGRLAASPCMAWMLAAAPLSVATLAAHDPTPISLCHSMAGHCRRLRVKRRVRLPSATTARCGWMGGEAWDARHESHRMLQRSWSHALLWAMPPPCHTMSHQLPLPCLPMHACRCSPGATRPACRHAAVLLAHWGPWRCMVPQQQMHMVCLTRRWASLQLPALHPGTQQSSAGRAGGQGPARLTHAQGVGEG